MIRFWDLSGTEQEAAVLRYFVRCGRASNPRWWLVALEGADNLATWARLDRATADVARLLGMVDAAAEALSDAADHEAFAAEIRAAVTYFKGERALDNYRFHKANAAAGGFNSCAAR